MRTPDRPEAMNKPWQAPRIVRLAARGTGNGGVRDHPDVWEGGDRTVGPGNSHPTPGYRMPTSTDLTDPRHDPTRFPF